MARIRSMKPETRGNRLIFSVESRYERWDHTLFDHLLPLESTLLYRMFGADRLLLYIGISRNPVQRWRKHRLEQLWWQTVVQIECEINASEYAALTAEVAAIRAERPLFNVRSAVA